MIPSLLGERFDSEALGIPVKPDTLWNTDNYGICFQLPQMTPMFEGLFPEVLRRYEDGLWQIERITARALGVMANHVRTDEQPGLPMIVFNTLGWQRDVAVEVPLQNVNSQQRPLGSVPRVVDATGKAIPVQLGDKHHDGQPINLTGLPACGWQTFYYQCDEQCRASTITSTACCCTRVRGRTRQCRVPRWK